MARQGNANNAVSVAAAENILGTILRGAAGGDIGLEGLSELEESLGIRVVRGNNRGGPPPHLGDLGDPVNGILGPVPRGGGSTTVSNSGRLGVFVHQPNPTGTSSRGHAPTR